METRYKVNFKNSCSRNCDFCPDFGALSTHNLSTLDANRISAKSRDYSSLVVPCNFDFSNNENDLIQKIKGEDQNIIQQIHIDHFISIDEIIISKSNLQIVTDDYLKLLKVEPLDLSQVESYLFVVKKSNYKKVLKHWFKLSAKIRNKIKFYFTQKDKSEVGYLSCNQIYNFRKSLYKVDSNICDQQFASDFDLFEPRVAIDMDLEGEYEPLFTHKTEQTDIKLSIVIPSYNNKDEVLQTIKFLNTQNLPKNQYELICVDDGSTDKTTNFIQDNFKKLGYSVNFKLIRYPRIIPRSPGDKRFRAGLARNVGSKHATGKYLMFCDADIVFLKNSLETILDELQTHDVIQIQRHYLNQGVKTSQLYRSDFDVDKNTFHPNNGYWKDFYDDGENWMKHKAPWKYICTFGLALKKEDFINSGRFRKVFLNYGFEDTDLGYRLFKMDKTFKLSSVKAYHQFGKFERNEYAHSSFKRHNLLSTTAKIFYRHYADPDIFEELPSFLRV